MLNNLIDKFLSKKLLVWIISTILLYFKIIDQNIWLYLTLTYLGIEGLLDTIIRWKLNLNGTNQG